MTTDRKRKDVNMRSHIRIAALILASLTGCGAGGSSAEPTARTSASQTTPSGVWYAAWTTAHKQVSANPVDNVRSANLTSSVVSLSNNTARMVTRVSASGDAVRVKLRNDYGSNAITIGNATLAIRAQGADVVAGSLRPLTFGGRPDVTIDVGEDVFSDPVELQVDALQDLAVSFYVPGSGSPSQNHNAWVTSYVTEPGDGDHVADESGTAFTTATTAALLVEEVSVRNSRLAGTIIAVGSSVVDGNGSTVDGYDRWTDQTAARIVAELPEGRRLGIGNEGYAGDVTADILARFQRDVLDKTGLTHVILYAGTNDLTLPPQLSFTGQPDASTADRIIANMRQIIAMAHAAGKKIVLSTITPRLSNTPSGNAERKKVNDWIRKGQNCSGECDGIVDFDAAIAWYAYPNAIDPLYTSDTLHPNPEGYRRMADSINLGLFAP